MGNNKKIIILFGPPGSGKGTQAEILGKKTGLTVISPGNLFRHEQAENTRLGGIISKYTAKGELVPDRIANKIIEKRFAAPDAKIGFILDGYPRQASQLKSLTKYFSKILKKTDKVIALYIDISDQAVVKHISGRRVCDCGASYHIKFKPPKSGGICDVCGRKLHQRKDDAPAIVRKRLKGFHERIKPLLDYFNRKDLLIMVDGSGSIKKVEAEIWKKLKKYLNL